MSDTNLKQRLAEIINQTLCTEVTYDQELQEGGLIDSMNAIDLVLAVNKAFGCKLPTSQIDEYLQSVNSLAEYMEQHSMVNGAH